MFNVFRTVPLTNKGYTEENGIVIIHFRSTTGIWTLCETYFGLTLFDEVRTGHEDNVITCLICLGIKHAK